MLEKDLYRDTPVRYLGYANEIGEAFRPLIPAYLVRLSYGIATAYVLADTCDKSYREYRRTHSTTRTIIKGGDVFIWQMLASVFIPGFTINRVIWGSNHILRFMRVRGPNTQYIPTLIGLSCIPFIIKPIDDLVDYLMDKTYRKVFD